MRSMQRPIAILAGAVLSLAAAGAASAGALQYAEFSLSTPYGGIGPLSTAGPSGAFYTDGVASVAAGTGFSSIATAVPITTQHAVVTQMALSLGANGGIRIDPAAPVPVATTAPLTGKLVYGNASGAAMTIPLRAGAGSPTSPAVVTASHKIPFIGTSFVTLSATGWHLGTVRATGLTLSGSPLPDVTLQGYTLLQPGLDAAYVRMVSLARIQTRGPDVNGSPSLVSNAVLGMSLYMVWDATTPTVDPLPEPGTPLLLIAAALGLVALGRSKGRLQA